jgi:hypothetical protein
VVAFDNVSSLLGWLSDDISRLATGIGFGTQLYSDMDEILVNVSRPVAMDGIAEVASRGDLLDRSLVLYLPRLRRYIPRGRTLAGVRSGAPSDPRRSLRRCRRGAR